MIEFLWSSLAFIVAISVLVAIHEFGHFWVARRLGFKVLTFSIGFGRPLLRWRSSDADAVEYRVSAIPLGGYVKMLDEREGEVEPQEAHRAFNRRPAWARIAVLAAGPGANFLFAIVAYWIMFITGVDEIRPYFGGIRQNSVAAEAGLRGDDVITHVGGQATGTLDEAVVAMFDELLSEGVIELEVEGVDGSTREAGLDVRGRVNELTEPDALLNGLGLVVGPQVPAIVNTVTEDAPAARAGIEAGDRLVSIDGESVEFFSDIERLISARPGEDVSVVVMRDGVQHEFGLGVALQENPDGEPVGRIGIGSREFDSEKYVDRLYTLRRYGPIEGIGVATVQTWRYVVLSVRFIGRMITGDVSLRNVSGPVMIAAYAGDFAQAGINRFLQFLAMISISLGIVNLLPVPILDGGQIVVAAIEGVKGRPLSLRAVVVGQQVGIAMLIVLMGIVFYNDITRLLGS